jgi:hypothetical protein
MACPHIAKGLGDYDMMVVELKTGEKLSAIAQFQKWPEKDRALQSGVIALMVEEYGKIQKMGLAESILFMVSPISGAGLSEMVSVLLFLVPGDYVNLYDDPDFIPVSLPIREDVDPDASKLQGDPDVTGLDADFEVGGDTGLIPEH